MMMSGVKELCFWNWIFVVVVVGVVLVFFYILFSSWCFMLAVAINYNQHIHTHTHTHEQRPGGYSYADIISIRPDLLPGYDEKVKSFFEEHIHDAEGTYRSGFIK
jgi:hypothetical protein